VGDAVNDLLHAVVAEHRLHGPGIEPSGLEQEFVDRPVTQTRDAVGPLEPAHLEDGLPHEAVAVGVKAARGDADGDVVRLDLPAVDDMEVESAQPAQRRV
jgi:hypothetical protein